ncbi:hypothetical protein GW923_00685 [Candidatus Pacearchaeota archaeon]|nr:hypothetical protein [Candidatus Pacearchaeota archaeon]
MKKKGVVWDHLVPWIIGVGLLILGLVIYALFSDNATGFAGFIKNLLRFG